MKRKDFLATGIVGLGGVIALTSAMVLKSEDKKSSQGNFRKLCAFTEGNQRPFPQ